jgi:hypothetical protein
MKTSCRPLLLAAIALLVFTGPASANTIAPTAFFMPGYLPLMAGLLALPASVLAAVVERPFVTRAGVTSHTTWYSLQANFVSLLVGYATIPVAIGAIGLAAPLWSLAAIALSILFEGRYYEVRKLNLDHPLKWRWIVWGNICSSVILLLIPFAAIQIRTSDPHLARDLDHYEELLLWSSVAVSITVFAACFFMPLMIRRWRIRVLERLSGVAIQQGQPVSISNVVSISN